MRNLIVVAVVMRMGAGMACCSAQAERKDAQSGKERPAPVSIVVAVQAAEPERLAARELAKYLGMLYPRTAFEIGEGGTTSGPAIRVGCAASAPELGTYLGGRRRPGPEGYAITTARIDDRETGIVFGGSPAATLFGVYGLLERLGFGFYPSYDASPGPRQDGFSFDGWDLANEPLVETRVVFNWHNFLSGCSTWNLSDWNKWTAQAQKMGYNGIMVHAYGNNPMVSFQFNGAGKPAGYLSTTVKGRDWSVNHVNDVRRLYGGEVFSDPVFGARAAQVPDGQRVEAAESLMRQVFAFAKKRGMDVVLAVDVDTESANPQAIIRTLPENARFAIRSGTFWLANPETEAGYEYYRAQVQAVVRAYPSVDQLTVWFRRDNTPWMGLGLLEMPESWRRQYQAELVRTPEVAALWKSHGLFALGKVVSAFERALGQIGRGDVRVCVGSWGFEFLPAADRFLAPQIRFYALDYDVLHGKSQLETAESRRVIRQVAEHRSLIPVVWAHHDDGRYFGRSFTPFEGFDSRLEEAGAAGFGIIHWMTRPLDLYFSSLGRQVWRESRDEPLKATCDRMAERSFGRAAGEAVGRYLHRWITEAPLFGRETTDLFIDRDLVNVDQAVAGCRDRLKLLDKVDESRLTAEQRDRVNYFKGLEAWVGDFYRTQEAFQSSWDLLEKGDLPAAKRAMGGCHPTQVIEKFSRFASLGGLTRGEEGLIVSMNLRWLPHFIRRRQMLGMEAIRYNFAPTSHDPLAQSPGWLTFHVDPDRQWWQTLGEYELGGTTFLLSQADVREPEGGDNSFSEICRAGIESDRPLVIRLGPIYSLGAQGTRWRRPLPPGDYRLTLLMVDPVSTAAGQRVFDIATEARRASAQASTEPAESALTSDRVDIFAAVGRNRALQRGYPIKLAEAGEVVVTLTPVAGRALVCGVVLEQQFARPAP